MRSCKTAPRKRTYALPGDFVQILDSLGRHNGRVIGQITECDDDGPNCVGFLRVAVIDDHNSFGYERWIEPGMVRRCTRPEHIAPFMVAFANASVAELEEALADNENQLAASRNRPGKLWTREG